MNSRWNFGSTACAHGDWSPRWARAQHHRQSRPELRPAPARRARRSAASGSTGAFGPVAVPGIPIPWLPSTAQSAAARERNPQGNSTTATIAGGFLNVIQTNDDEATIAGGENNFIQHDADHSTIAGGKHNFIQPFADYSSIGGGNDNTIVGSATLPVRATIGGGDGNTTGTNSSWSTIGGGRLDYLISRLREFRHHRRGRTKRGSVQCFLCEHQWRNRECHWRGCHQCRHRWRHLQRCLCLRRHGSGRFWQSGRQH